MMKDTRDVRLHSCIYSSFRRERAHRGAKKRIKRCETEKDRDRKTERDRERRRDREAERQRERQRGRERQRETRKDRERYREEQRERQTERDKERQRYILDVWQSNFALPLFHSLSLPFSTKLRPDFNYPFTSFL